MKKLSFISYALVIAITLSAVEPLTLDSCLTLAKHNNPELRKAQLEIDKAQQVKAQAFTKYFPQIQASAGAFHALHPLVELTIDDIGNASVRELLNYVYVNYGDALHMSNSINLFQYGYTAGVTAVQPVFAGGKIVAGNKLAKVGVEAAKLQAEITERDVLQQVEESYWLLYGLQQKRLLVFEFERMLDTITRQVQSAVDAGLALPSDMVSVELRKDHLARQQLMISNGQQLARRALALSIGYDADSLDIDIEPDLPDKQLVHASDAQTNNTAEHRLLKLQLRAAKLERHMTLADALPQIAFGANYSYGKLQADILREGLRSKTGNGALFVTVSVPLTQWWETGHKLKMHNLTMEQVQIDADYLGEQLNLRTQQAYDRVVEAEALLRIQQRTASHAEEAFRQAQINYNAGRATITDLLKAQTEYNQAQSDVTDAHTAYFIALRRYCSLSL